jgi:hypothetical protein
MGNVQGYGAYDARLNNSNTSKNNDSKDIQNVLKDKAMKDMLQDKKYDVYANLELYNNHINIAVLEQNFKLKNMEIIKNLDEEIKIQENDIKKLEGKYLAKVKDFKYSTEKLNYNKNLNEVLFYIALLMIMALVGVIIWAINNKK